MNDQVPPIRKTVKKNAGIRRVLVLLIAFTLNLVYLSGAIQYGATEANFFDKTFEKLDSRAKVGLNEADFEAVKQKLIDYVGLKTEEFSVLVTINGQQVDFFNDKERAHMLDVRSLFVLNKNIFIIALILTLGMYLFGKYALKQRLLLAEALSISGIMMMVFAFALGLVASQDFTAVFIQFHELFFNNQLWLLDPVTDRMIVLLEEQFFSDMALHIGLYAVLLAIFGTAVGIVCKKNS